MAEKLSARVKWLYGSGDLGLYQRSHRGLYISDRTRSRWGRRRPFLLFGALPFAATFLLLWWRPPFVSPVALGIYYSLAFALYDTAATFVYMPYFALTPELSGDYDERTGLTSTRMFFSILGSLIAFTLPIQNIIIDADGDSGFSLRRRDSRTAPAFAKVVFSFHQNYFFKYSSAAS